MYASKGSLAIETDLDLLHIRLSLIAVHRRQPVGWPFQWSACEKRVGVAAIISAGRGLPLAGFDCLMGLVLGQGDFVCWAKIKEPRIHTDELGL